MKYLYVLMIIGAVVACKNSDHKTTLSAEEIIEKSMQASGTTKVGYSEISFVFREITYRAIRHQGAFELSRNQIKEGDTIVDKLSNQAFERSINGEAVKVTDSMANNFSNSINSVHYFSVLPYGLNDAAVRLNYLDSVRVKGKSYHKIQVSFQEEGGGTDFEDVFVYWINKDSYFIDYLAYEFHVNGGGIRFREAYNARTIGGIRFVDYNNFKPKGKDLKLQDTDKAFENGELELLSKIALEAISVN